MGLKVGVSWAALVALTGLLTAVMRLAHIPAALMLGPMLAAIVVALFRPGAKLPKASTVVAQAVMGCLIAHALSPHLLIALAPQWPILLGMNLALMLGIAGLGVLVTRLQWLPGTAGIWGMSPGGAGAMVLLAEAYGGDKRLVAVMQYLRLLCAALAVVAMGSLLGQPHAPQAAVALPGNPSTPWLAPIALPGVGMMIALSALAVLVSRLFRKPLLVLFLPIIGGVVAQMAGLPAPDVPPLVSAAAFALVGWHVGLSFTRESLVYCARLLPRVFGCIVAILLLCTAMAALLARLADVSFLTAYMALNPGGADVVLVMAANISVDLPLILAMQISRVLLVVALAPALGRWASSHHQDPPEQGPGVGLEDGAERLAKDVDAVL